MRGSRGRKNGNSSNNPFSTTATTAASAITSTNINNNNNNNNINNNINTSTAPMTSSRKSVDLGVPGETPKKLLSFSSRAPPAHIRSSLRMHTLASEADDEADGLLQGALLSLVEEEDEEQRELRGEQQREEQRGGERPKTGRGKAHPSPDEFFDYVVPSPQKRATSAQDKPKRIVIHPSSSSREGAQRSRSVSQASRASTATVSTASTASTTTRTRLAEENYLLGLNVDGVSRERQVSLLGCWLFGSALKI